MLRRIGRLACVSVGDIATRMAPNRRHITVGCTAGAAVKNVSLLHVKSTAQPFSYLWHQASPYRKWWFKALLIEMTGTDNVPGKKKIAFISSNETVLSNIYAWQGKQGQKNVCLTSGPGKSAHRMFGGWGEIWRSCICFITDLSEMSTLEIVFYEAVSQPTKCLHVLWSSSKVHGDRQTEGPSRIENISINFSNLKFIPIASRRSIKMQRICPFNVTNTLSCFSKNKSFDEKSFSDWLWIQQRTINDHPSNTTADQLMSG